LVYTFELFVSVLCDIYAKLCEIKVLCANPFICVHFQPWCICGGLPLCGAWVLISPFFCRSRIYNLLPFTRSEDAASINTVALNNKLSLFFSGMMTFFVIIPSAPAYKTGY
jgi:hypothetical protein